MRKIVLILLLMSVSNLSAGSLSWDIYLAGVSKYLWRGQNLYNKFALQPGGDIAYGDFSFGFWGSYGVPDRDFAEADFLLNYSRTFSSVTIGAGFTFYTFPSAKDKSYEAYISVGYETLFSPSLSIYYDFGSGNGVYVEASAGYDIAGPVPLSISVTLGYNGGQWGYDPSFSVLGINLSVPIKFGNFSVSPSLFGQIALDRQYSNDIAGGITLGYNL